MRAAFEGPIEVDGHVSWASASVPRCFTGMRATWSLCSRTPMPRSIGPSTRAGAIRLFTSAIDQQLQGRRALEHDLRFAVERAELYLAYQPQQHRQGGTTGYEALVRWRRPKRGIVARGEFMPVAERSGSIAQIDDWVMMEACRETASCDRPFRIAVNVLARAIPQGKTSTHRSARRCAKAGWRRPAWNCKSPKAS
ncbi:EAL domain-containing protein [Bradyrhizobium barranii]|uniref:EAL domain-containing protein n=1 Tax=Bradyrhizobium TaxID=374 RepID=UPI003F26785A